MDHQAALRAAHIEPHAKGARMRDFILGWQDGLVNVLGVILGVAVATSSTTIVIIAAIAAAFAESISMAAVAYTSFKAEREYYQAEVAREKREMHEFPQIERKEIYDIYRKLGFRGPLLGRIVKHITSDKKRWLDVMMKHELKLFPSKASPINIAAVVGISAIIGSFIPVIPFLIYPVKTAISTTLVISTVVLFFVGVYKAKTTIGNPVKSGIELAAIGMLAAVIGYAVGAILGATVVG
jgi:VIT1/CCC1 family predicted Fe2+/Mn2+ transporter